MQLSIIIVNYNTREMTAECIRSIYANETLRGVLFEIILVDNASSDDTAAYIRQTYPDVRIIENTVNAGFGKANNAGVRMAAGEWVLLLNSDTTVGDTDFDTVLLAACGTSDVGALSVKLLNTDGSPQCVGYEFPSVWGEVKINLFLSEFSFRKKKRLMKRADIGLHASDWVSGAFMLVKRAVYEEIGGFDEKIFMYSEDIDLCARLRANGYTNYVLDTVRVYHHMRGTDKSGGKKPVKLRTLLDMKRNYYYVIKKNNLMRPLWFAKCLGTVNVLFLWLYKKIK